MAAALEKADFTSLNPLRLSSELRRLTALELRLENSSAARQQSMRELSSALGKLMELRKVLLGFHSLALKASNYSQVQAMAPEIRDAILRFWPDLPRPTRRKP